MKTILIHPTHRKIVRLLRNHIAAGKHLKITAEDIAVFKQIINRTQKSAERHRGIYRILLSIMGRLNNDNSSSMEEDLKIIARIEKSFARAEIKRLHITLINTALSSILRKLLKRHKTKR